MNATEYYSLKRFETDIKTDFETFYSTLFLCADSLFQIYTLHNQLIYAKITNEFENLIFDIKQTTQQGEPINRPLYTNCLTKKQIAERIYQGDWSVCMVLNKK